MTQQDLAPIADFLRPLSTYISENFLIALLPIAASLITLWLTNKHNARSQAAQFEHAERESEAQRKHQMRLEAYQEVMTELISSQGTLAKLPYGKVDDETSNQMAAFFRAMARAGLVAEQESAMLMLKITDSVGSLYLWIIEEWTFIQEKEYEISAFENELDATNMALDNFPRTDPFGQANDLQDLLDVQEKLIRTLTTLEAELNLARRTTVETFLQRFSTIKPIHNTLLAALRTDLGLSTDLALLEQRTNQSFAAMKNQLYQFLDRMERDSR